MSVRQNIGHIMNQSAKSERLNSVTRFYLGSLKVATMVTVPSAFCRFQLTQMNHHCMIAAAN